MRYLYYTNYQAGLSGLSNGIMSIECGVILAHLTNRLLVLHGNVAPPANLVDYDRRVNNQRPSRVTDLLDIPVAWVEPEAVDLEGLASRELTNWPAWSCALYFPKTLDLSTEDALSFARDRTHWVTVDGELERIPVLRISEEPLVPGTSQHRSNLCFYSYQFYLDAETRRSVYRLLQGMQAKRPFADLAARVARDLGRFNAVHMRRGDFKVTYGVTTLDRTPAEAIEAMDQVFDRKDPLVILTDERDDPFFQEIKRAFPKHVFVDWHILDEYGADFARLPQTDSLSLAYLSQLVAAESAEFMGTMTSTFTALIQRYRGNRGKAEAFRYLWNELPGPGEDYERGRHAISDCIPLERGEMIEERPGRYSWNRVSQLLNPAWMREWPESFLLPERIATGVLLPAQTDALGTEEVASRAVAPVMVHAAPAPTIVTAKSVPAATKPSIVHVSFENLQVAVWSKDAALIQQLAPELGASVGSPARNVITRFEISQLRADCRIEQKGGSTVSCDRAQLGAALKQQIGRVFALARHDYAWLAAAAFSKAGRGIVVAGDIGVHDDAFRRTMQMNGWNVIDGSVVSIRLADLMLVPLGARAQPEGAAAQIARVATPFEGVVVVARAPLHARTATLAPLSPAAAVAKLVGVALDFQTHQQKAVRSLCRALEARPAAQIHWSRPQDAATEVARFAEQPNHSKMEVA